MYNLSAFNLMILLLSVTHSAEILVVDFVARSITVASKVTIVVSSMQKGTGAGGNGQGYDPAGEGG